MKPIPVVSGSIENGRGEVLLAQRPPGKRLAGFWEFPGGKVEHGETLFEALVREWQEEFEMEISPTEHLFSVEHPPFMLEFVKGSTTTVPKALHSHLAYKWVTTAELFSLPDTDSAKRIRLLTSNIQFTDWWKKQQ